MADGGKSSLSYEQPASSPVPRWQFRLLFLLVLINLAITIQTAYAPGVGAGVKRWWADYQAARRTRALYRQAAAWALPAGTVVWEEDFEAAAKLLAGANYVPAQLPASISYGNYRFLAGWPRGAAAKPPAVASQLQRSFPIYDDQGNIPQRVDDWALLLLHDLQSPAGTRRLVYVVLEGKTDLHGSVNASSEGPVNRPIQSTLSRKLRLIAAACQTDGTKEPRPRKGETTELLVAPGGDLKRSAPWHWDPPADGQPGKVRVDPVNRFRFYAAQPDPADPSHFTIDYELDGERSRIHGRLKDDGVVEFKPDAGTVNPPFWDPRG